MATKTKRPAKKTPAAANGKNGAPIVGERKEVPIERIVPSPFQQRTDLPKAKVDELAESIRQVGLLQPIIVRPKAGYRTPLAEADWELIAGECRWRACKALGDVTIRVEVWDVDDRACREMVAAENFKRNDLNAIEEARTYEQAIDAGDAAGPTELAEQYGVSQPHVSNRLRLLGLPAKVQAKIISREIPPTHARHLVPLKNHPKILDGILDDLETELKRAKKWGDGTLTVNEFRDVVEGAVYSQTKSLAANPWASKLCKNLPPLKLSQEQREALRIITIPAQNGRKALELVANVKLLDELRKEQEQKAIARAEKREAGKGSHKGTKAQSGNGKAPKVKVSLAEQKRREAEEREKAKLQGEKFRRALWRWYVDWLRWLVARELRQTTGLNDLFLILLLRAGKWYHYQVDAEQCLVDAARAIKSPIGNNAAKDLVGKVGDDELFPVAREFAARLFHTPDRPSPLVPDGDVGVIAGHLAIHVEATWLKEQAGPAYSEAYWRLHTIEQLGKLATELRVKIEKGSKKSDYVETLLAMIPATDTGKPAGLALPKEIKTIKRPRGY